MCKHDIECLKEEGKRIAMMILQDMNLMKVESSQVKEEEYALLKELKDGSVKIEIVSEQWESKLEIAWLSLDEGNDSDSYSFGLETVPEWEPRPLAEHDE